MSEAKSTRDSLLARHAHATPALDALRRAAVPPPPITGRELWRELFLPQRRLWQVLAAVWVALLAFHFTAGRSRPPRPAQSPPPEVVAAWLAQFKSHDLFAQMDRRP